jgi:hypothetical protein
VLRKYTHILKSYSYPPFFVVLGIGPRALYLALPFEPCSPALLFVFGFWDRVCLTLPRLTSTSQFSCLHLLVAGSQACATTPGSKPTSESVLSDPFQTSLPLSHDERFPSPWCPPCLLPGIIAHDVIPCPNMWFSWPQIICNEFPSEDMSPWNCVR